MEPDHSSCTSLCLLILALLSAAMVAACLPSGAFGCLWCADYWHPVREHRLTSQTEIASCRLTDLRPESNPSAIVSCVLSQTAGPSFSESDARTYANQRGEHHQHLISHHHLIIWSQILCSWSPAEKHDMNSLILLKREESKRGRGVMINWLEQVTYWIFIKCAVCSV